MFSATLRRTEHRRRPLPAHLASHPLGNLAPSIGECPRISTPPRLTCPYAGVELPTVDEVELVDEVLDGALDPTKRRANWSTCRAAHFLIRPPQLRPDCARELVVRPHHRRTHPASVIVLKPTLRENPRPHRIGTASGALASPATPASAPPGIAVANDFATVHATLQRSPMAPSHHDLGSRGARDSNPPSRAMPGPTPTSSAPVLEVPRVRFRNPHLPHPHSEDSVSLPV